MPASRDFFSPFLSLFHCCQMNNSVISTQVLLQNMQLHFFFFSLLQSAALNSWWTPASPPPHPLSRASSLLIRPCSEAAPTAAGSGCDISPAVCLTVFPAEPPSLPPDTINLLFCIYSGPCTRRWAMWKAHAAGLTSSTLLGLWCLHSCDIIVCAVWNQQSGRMMKCSGRAAVALAATVL